MRGLLVAAVIMSLPFVTTEARADDWADDDDLGVDYAFTSSVVHLDKLFPEHTDLSAALLLTHLPDLFACHAAVFFTPRTSEPFRGPAIEYFFNEGRMDVSAINIRDLHDSHRYEHVSWRIRFTIPDEDKRSLLIGLGQRVLSRKGGYNGALSRFAQRPAQSDFVFDRDVDDEERRVRVIIGREEDSGALATGSKSAVTIAYSQILQCIRELVEFGDGGQECQRPGRQGSVLRRYTAADERCERVASIREQLGMGEGI